MADTLAAETAVIDKLTGVYIDEKDKTGKLNFLKRTICYGWRMKYTEKTLNTQAIILWISRNACGIWGKISFWIMPTGSIILTFNYVNDDLVKHTSVSVKA